MPIKVEISVGKNISAAETLPALCRRVITVDGKSCTLVEASTDSVVAPS